MENEMNDDFFIGIALEENNEDYSIEEITTFD